MCGNARLLDTRSRLHLTLLAQLVSRACPAGGVSRDSRGGSSSSSRGANGKTQTQASQLPSQFPSQLPTMGTASDKRRSSSHSSSSASSGWEGSGAATPWAWLFDTLISALDADDASIAALSDPQNLSGKGLSSGNGGSGASGGASIGLGSSIAGSQRPAGAGGSGLVRGGALSRSRGGSGLRLVSLRCLPLLQLLAAVLELFPHGEAWLGPKVAPGQGATASGNNSIRGSVYAGAAATTATDSDADAVRHMRYSRLAQHLSTLASIVQVLSVRVLNSLASSSSLAQGSGGSSAGGFGAALQYWTVLALSQAARASALAIGRCNGSGSSRCHDGEASALAQLSTSWQQVWSCATNPRRPYCQALVACEPGSLGEAVCALLAQLAASGLALGSATTSSSGSNTAAKHSLAMQLVALPVFRPRANSTTPSTATATAPATRGIADSDDNVATQTAAAAAASTSSGAAPTTAVAVLPSSAPIELAAIALQLLHESGAAEDALFLPSPFTDAAISSSSASSSHKQQQRRNGSRHGNSEAIFDENNASEPASAQPAAPQPTESPRAYLLVSLLWQLPLCTSAGPASLAALPSLRNALAAALAPQRIDQTLPPQQQGCLVDAPGACDDPVALPAALGQTPSAASALMNVGSNSNKYKSGSEGATSDYTTATTVVPLLQRSLVTLSEEVARHARTVSAASATAAEDFEDRSYGSGRSLLSRPCLVALFGLTQCARLLLSLRPAVIHACSESSRGSDRSAAGHPRTGGISTTSSSSSRPLLEVWDSAVASAVDSVATCLLQHPGWALDEELGASCCLARGGGLAAVWSPIAVLEAVVRLS